MKICGIDEAGRGPVIGPLVICGVLADEEQEKELMELGVKDSKLLTPVQRERMFDKIKNIVEAYEVVIVDPAEIDSVVGKGKHMNLNWLEADKSVQIINTLKPNTAILDCPSTNTAKYAEYLKSKIKGRVNLIAEHKADQTYPIVSAASILAKVTRDELIQELKKKYKVEFGSGYPSDPLTQIFLQKYWDKFDFFRKSWESYKAAVKGKSQTKLFSDE